VAYSILRHETDPPQTLAKSHGVIGTLLQGVRLNIRTSVGEYTVDTTLSAVETSHLAHLLGQIFPPDPPPEQTT
jgi:hypothetical protein